MDALTFEPVATMLRLTKTEKEPGEVFNTMVAGLVEALATRCASEKHTLVGHIKGFSAGPDNSYLRVSVSGDGRPVDLEGAIASDSDSILLALNINVFGISAVQIRELLIESIKDLCVQGKAAIAIVDHPLLEKTHAPILKDNK